MNILLSIAFILYPIIAILIIRKIENSWVYGLTLCTLFLIYIKSAFALTDYFIAAKSNLIYISLIIGFFIYPFYLVGLKFYERINR